MPDAETNTLFPYICNIFADYYQIYLQDEQMEEDIHDDWGEQLTTQMVVIAPGIIGIGTVRNTTVPVRIDLLKARPDNNFTFWDHVAEASLEIPSGQLVLAGSVDYLPDAKRFSVTPGTYRVRTYYGGLSTISENGLEGEDRYSIVLWPEEYAEPEILKRWSPSNTKEIARRD